MEPRITIEMLEPRTLFSGGHGLLRADVGGLSSNHASVLAVSAAGASFASAYHVAVLPPAHLAQSDPPSQLHAAIGGGHWGKPTAAPPLTNVDADLEQIAAIADKAFAGLSPQTLEFIATHDPGPFGRLLRLEKSLGGSLLVELPLPPQAGAVPPGHAAPHKGSHDSAHATGNPDTSSADGADAAGNATQREIVVFGPNGVRIVLNVGGDTDSGQPAVGTPSTSQPSTTPTPPPETSFPQSPASGSVVTPLAMTPAAQSAWRMNSPGLPAASVTSVAAPPPLVVQAVPASTGSLMMDHSAAPDAEALAGSAHPLGIMADVVPGALQAPQAVAVVSDAVRIADGMVHAAGRITGHAAHLFTAMLPAESLPATVAYSFMYIDAPTFNDAVTALAGELASVTAPAAAHPSTARAWEITAVVLGLDALCFAYLYHKSRSDRAAREATPDHPFDFVPET